MAESKVHIPFKKSLACVLAAFFLVLCSCTVASQPSDEGTSSAATATGQIGTTELEERTLFVFDTVVTLKAYCSSELMDQAVDRCNYFEQHFSRTIEGSDIWTINHAGGAPVEVAPETADIIEKSLDYCRQSDGLFDITIGSVSSLWNFKEGIKPDDAAIQEAISHIDWRGVSVQGTTVTLADPQAMIDLGGIAKGYIADDLAKLLEEGGCTGATINLGGNAYALGTKPDGSLWNVGVQDPNGADRIVAKVSCSDASVVTSGLYERKFEDQGVTYYHILDPRTGYPVETDLESASVLSESSTDGDAYATWLFLLGRDRAYELIEQTEGLESLLVDDTGAITTTSSEFQIATSK